MLPSGEPGIPPRCRRIYANSSRGRNPAIRRDPGHIDMFGATNRLRLEMPSSPADMIASGRPINSRRATPAARVIALATATALVALPARAQPGPPIIRDAEIEQLLKEYTQPILR